MTSTETQHIKKISNSSEILSKQLCLLQQNSTKTMQIITARHAQGITLFQKLKYYADLGYCTTYHIGARGKPMQAGN
jgi:hypothetical protein